MESQINRALYGQRGQRKQKVTLITSIFLLVGFVIAAWMKVDFNLFLAYSLGITGSSFGFMYGNVQENKTDATIIAAGKTPLP